MNCKKALGLLARCWAVVSTLGILTFAFFDIPSWTTLENDGWGVLRGVVIAIVYVGGVVAAFRLAEDCR